MIEKKNFGIPSIPDKDIDIVRFTCLRFARQVSPPQDHILVMFYRTLQWSFFWRMIHVGINCQDSKIVFLRFESMIKQCASKIIASDWIPFHPPTRRFWTNMTLIMKYGSIRSSQMIPIFFDYFFKSSFQIRFQISERNNCSPFAYWLQLHMWLIFILFRIYYRGIQFMINIESVPDKKWLCGLNADI